MCTIGVSRFGPDEYILFKNKDFGRPVFDDRIVVEPEMVGARGLSTWAGSDPGNDAFSGISIGANAGGLLCCDADVDTVEQGANYDKLVEIALRAGGGVTEAIAAIRGPIARRPYLGANIIMIDGLSSAVVEVRGDRIEVTMVEGPTARSNHHVKLAVAGERSASLTTEARLAAAQRRLQAAASVDDVLDLQQAHDEGSTGICSHQGRQTVYGYVLRRQSGITTLNVTQGHPCQATAKMELVLPLGDRWSEDAAADFRSGYPSAEAMLVD